MEKVALFAVFIFSFCVLRGEDTVGGLVVHEWGTFTSLQDEAGNALGGINTDDEPVPSFVSRIGHILQDSNVPGPKWSQGATYCHPDVTMRLETPVLYFYAPAGRRIAPLDVQVAFHGGWLTEFYPNAYAKAPNFNSEKPDSQYGLAGEAGYTWISKFGHLKTDTLGELFWKGIILGKDGGDPETTDKVWLAPRAVKSTHLTTADGKQGEKFLFYRGVANRDASLRVSRNATDNTLEIRDTPAVVNFINASTGLRIHAAWLLDVRPDGVCAFRSLGALEYGAEIRAKTPATFETKDYAAENLTRLRNEMHKALVGEGLYADEADALLNTWELSYFKSPGMRLFYLCPRDEIANVLPLKISQPADITRVMVGRLELVTPAQRELLKVVATAAPPRYSGSLDDLQKSEGFIAYSKLGRFRNALLLDEQKKRPTKILDDFVANGGYGAAVVY